MSMETTSNHLYKWKIYLYIIDWMRSETFNNFEKQDFEFISILKILFNNIISIFIYILHIFVIVISTNENISAISHFLNFYKNLS